MDLSAANPTTFPIKTQYYGQSYSDIPSISPAPRSILSEQLVSEAPFSNVKQITLEKSRMIKGGGAEIFVFWEQQLLFPSWGNKSPLHILREQDQDFLKLLFTSQN